MTNKYWPPFTEPFLVGGDDIHLERQLRKLCEDLTPLDLSMTLIQNIM